MADQTNHQLQRHRYGVPCSRLGKVLHEGQAASVAFGMSSPLDPPPWTPETLAERWGCSAAIIRRLCRNGELAHFRLGGKLLRIPYSVVLEWESVRHAKPPEPQPGPNPLSDAAPKPNSDAGQRARLRQVGAEIRKDNAERRQMTRKS